MAPCLADVSNDWLLQLQVGFLELLIVVWVAFAGAAIGSFLNVVAYRMPQRRSVIFHRSSCPSCGYAIRSRDNIPIFSWLWLEGRCRYCAGTISPRYPIVEFAFMVISLVLLFVHLASPTDSAGIRDSGPVGLYRTIVYPQWNRIALFVLHWALFAALAAWTLIRIDAHRVPFRFYVWNLTWIIAVFLIWPSLFSPNNSSQELHPSGFLERVSQSLPQMVNNLIYALAGGAIAWLMCTIVENRRNAPTGLGPDIFGAVLIASIVLGWHSALVSLAIALALLLALPPRTLAPTYYFTLLLKI